MASCKKEMLSLLEVPMLHEETLCFLPLCIPAPDPSMFKRRASAEVAGMQMIALDHKLRCTWQVRSVGRD